MPCIHVIEIAARGITGEDGKTDVDGCNEEGSCVGSEPSIVGGIEEHEGVAGRFKQQKNGDGRKVKDLGNGINRLAVQELVRVAPGVVFGFGVAFLGNNCADGGRVLMEQVHDEVGDVLGKMRHVAVGARVWDFR